jgi:hypothetical protein
VALDLTGQAMDNVLLSKIEASIGTYRDSDLDIAIFNTQNLGTWMLCDGQDCSATEYFALTGKTTVPDFVSQGTFRRQAKNGRVIGSYESDDNKSHNHNLRRANGNDLNYGNYVPHVDDYSTGWGTTGIQSSGGAEARPKNIACNVFIKVSHT